MSEYRTVFHPEARAELRKLPRDTALRILTKLTKLRTEWESDPFGFTTTALDSQPDRRRLGVGDYRVIYTVDNGEVLVWVISVGHRSTIYRTRIALTGNQETSTRPAQGK
ncbi:type II toxin-antitoxin system RelE/ParE family toxin [Streptomyces sp. S1A(2023)]